MVIPAGVDLDAEILNDEFDLKPRGLLAWGTRATTSSSATSSTGVGVLRLDDIPVYGGRAYRIWSNPLFLFSTVSGDDVGVRVRYTTDGTTPTTSSSFITGASMQTRLLSTTNGVSLNVAVNYYPAADELLSVLLNVYRTSGTGSVTIFGSSTFPLHLYVEDVGLAVSDTGTST